MNEIEIPIKILNSANILSFFLIYYSFVKFVFGIRPCFV